MEENKRTPGRYLVDCGIDIVVNNELMQIIIFSDEINTHNVAHVFGFTREEVEANAKLLAKAPEMLEMLKKYLQEFEYDNATEYQCELFFFAKQLIKEATEN